MYKIRTMQHDAETDSGPVWTRPKDPRVTSVGRLLRKFHLDEIPQLINVLRGEMSLIGPRPERPEFVEVLRKSIPGYMSRLAVRPGITGLAQLNLPPDTDLESVRRKLVLDLEYVERASFLLDCRLLMCTVARLFKLPARLMMRVCGVSRTTGDADPRRPSSNGSGSAKGTAAAPLRIESAFRSRTTGNGNGSGNGDGKTAGHGRDLASADAEAETGQKPR
jgi:hypothetical protein